MRPDIRTALRSDLDGMLELWRALEDAQRDHRMFPVHADAESRARAIFEAYLDADDSRVLLAEDEDGGLLGMAIASMKDQSIWSINDAVVVELSKVVVRPDARGTGIGAALIDACLAFGKERGATYAVAKIFSGNADALSFWEHAGFVPRYEERARPL